MPKQVAAGLAAIFASLVLVSPAGARSHTASLMSAINAVRVSHGLPKLRSDARLQRAARAHSIDMIRRGYFAHGSMAARLARYGVRGPRVGENLAWGVGAKASPRAIVQAWMSSPPHRATLLRRGFRRVGIGSLSGRFAGFSRARVITADFAGR